MAFLIRLGTNIGLRPSPCHLQNDITCNGFSHIVIPGIGEADTRLLVLPFFLLVFTLVVYELTVQAFPIVHVILFADQTSVTRTIDIPGIGSGQATVQVS